MAECQDHDLYAVDFIPPQYYDRYIALSRFAKDIRLKDKKVKTQIRFGQKDVELLTKTRGSDERYEIVPMEEIKSTNPLPKFEHSKKWSRREDRPPRRRVSPNRGRLEVPSLRMEDENLSTTDKNPESLHVRKSRKTTPSHQSKVQEMENCQPETPATGQQSSERSCPTENIEIDEQL